MKIEGFIEKAIFKDSYHYDKFRDYFDKYCILVYDKEYDYNIENVVIMFNDLFRYSFTDIGVYLYKKMKAGEVCGGIYIAYMKDILSFAHDFYAYLDEQLNY